MMLLFAPLVLLLSMATFEDLFYGISQQESGGNYSAINSGSGALGKFQIMPGNVGAWSQKYLGTKWTPQQFLGDPYKQEALAKAVLSDYYDKYGARGAASAWYSGNPALNMNYGSQKGGPSIGAYVDQVLGKAMGNPGTPGTAYVQTAPVVNVDKTVKTPETLRLPGSAGVGAVSSPGVGAFGDGGMGAVTDGGMGAVGEGTGRTQPRTAAPAAQSQSGFSTGTATGSRATVITAANKWLGVPYVFGGGNAGGPTKSALANGNFNDVGFDCSGFVQYALAGAGIDAPRLSYDQLNMGPKIPVNKLQPGDLVGFEDGSHVAIYQGNGVIIEAAKTGTNVRQRQMGPNENAWGVSLAGLYK